MSQGIIVLTPELIAKQASYYAATPGYRKMRDLTVEYAHTTGGVTLEVWKRLRGDWFGEPQLMTAPAIAEDLGIPVSDLDAIWVDTWAWVGPRLDADPDYLEMKRGLPPMQPTP